MSTDIFLEEQRRNQLYQLPIPRITTAEQYKPAMIGTTDGRNQAVPPHQQFGTETQTFLMYDDPTYTDTTASYSTANQTSAVKMFEFQLETKDMHVVDTALEIRYNRATVASAYSAELPGPLCMERCEISLNGGQAIQTLYGDMVFNLMLLSVPPEVLYRYAVASGRWLNPPNMPGVSGKATYLTLTEGTPNTVAYNFHKDQQLSAVWTIFPYQPKTAATNYPDASGGFAFIRISLLGSLFHQMGIFHREWLGVNKLYLKFYSAGRWIYNTAESGSDHKITITSGRLVSTCLSFPQNTPAERAIEEIISGPSGLQVMFTDWDRTILSVAPTITSGTQYEVNLGHLAGKHISSLYLYGRLKAGWTTGSTGWLLGCTIADDPVPIPSGATTSNVYLGQRTAWGDQSATAPAADLIMSGGQTPLFTPNGVMLVETLKFHKHPKTPGNPYMYGLVPGQTCFSPLNFNVIPIHFGNPVKAAQGEYDGSMEFGQLLRLRITFGANALTLDAYDVYASYWKHMHINKNPRTGAVTWRVDDFITKERVSPKRIL